MNNELYNDVLLQEPFVDYCNSKKKYLTSHELNDYIKSQRRYHLKSIGAISSESSSALNIGAALHTLVLEGEQEYEQRYIVGGPINPKTQKEYGTETKAFAEYQSQNPNKKIITIDDDAIVRRMAESIKGNSSAVELLTGGLVERTVRTSVNGVQVQARIDCINNYMDAIVDLKTTKSLDTFAEDSLIYGYHVQLAFYKMALENAIFNKFGVTKQYNCFLIAVENNEKEINNASFRTGVWYYQSVFSPTEIVKNAIADYKKSIDTGEYVDKYDTLQTFTESDFVTK